VSFLCRCLIVAAACAVTACVIQPHAAADQAPSIQPPSAMDHAAAVQPPSAVIVRQSHLSPFYTKCIDLNGFPILGSPKVSDYALREAAYLVGEMLRGRDDILAVLVKNNVRFVVQAPTEMTTEIPEYSDLTPASYWDRRARGLGPTEERPAVSCGEENLLNYPGDPYHSENILIHEFAHAVADMGLPSIDPAFKAKLQAAYEDAKAHGRFKGFYAGDNTDEYWAEGVQSYFDANGNAGPGGKVIATREDLAVYDPKLEALIASVFSNHDWRYTRAATRVGKDHLRGYDIANAPRFHWPADQKSHR